jgi:hypothetical protein
MTALASPVSHRLQKAAAVVVVGPAQKRPLFNPARFWAEALGLVMGAALAAGVLTTTLHTPIPVHAVSPLLVHVEQARVLAKDGDFAGATTEWLAQNATDHTVHSAGQALRTAIRSGDNTLMQKAGVAWTASVTRFQGTHPDAPIGNHWQDLTDMPTLLEAISLEGVYKGVKADPLVLDQLIALHRQDPGYFVWLGTQDTNARALAIQVLEGKQGLDALMADTQGYKAWMAGGTALLEAMEETPDPVVKAPVIEATTLPAIHVFAHTALHARRKGHAATDSTVTPPPSPHAR